MKFALTFIATAIVMVAFTLTYGQYRDPKPAHTDATFDYVLAPNDMQREAMRTWDVDGSQPFLPPNYKFRDGDFVLSADGHVYLIDERRADEVQRGHDERDRIWAETKATMFAAMGIASLTIPDTGEECHRVYRSDIVANQAIFEAGLYADSPRQDEFYRGMQIAIDANRNFQLCLAQVRMISAPCSFSGLGYVTPTDMPITFDDHGLVWIDEFPKDDATQD